MITKAGPDIRGGGRRERSDLGLGAAFRARPFVGVQALELARRAGIAGQQVDMQMRCTVTEDGGVDVVGARHIAEGTAGPCAP